MPIRQKMPDFVNLANNGTASLDLPTGMSYHNIIFCFTGSGSLTRAMIKEVRVLINGKAFIRAPASILHRDNLYKGSADKAAYFMLDFEEPRARTFADQIATAVHTYNVNTFKIEFDIVGATSPKIETHANTTTTKMPLGLLPCFIKQSFDAVSVGTHQVAYSYGKVPHLLKRAHFVPIVANAEVLPVDHLNSVSLLKSNIPLLQKITPDSMVYYQEHYEAVPQANFLTVDFVEDNNTTINLMPCDDAVCLWELDVKLACRFDIYYSVLATIDTI